MIFHCPLCDRDHTSGATVTGSRFTTPPTYRATYPNSPTRDTREEARQDYCSWWNRRNPQ